MRTKWLLIALPLAILVLLFQSAFWVPSYASQAEGNPKRLVTFIRASIGDAKQLNPVIASDKGASEVMRGNIFEGLVEEDEHMELVPQLAQGYEITEEAYLAALPDRKLADGTPASGEALLAALTKAWKAGELGSLGAIITGIEPAKGEQRQVTDTVLAKNAKGRDEPVDVELTVDVPERVKLSLSRVEPGLFEALQPVVGKAYFENYPFEGRFKLQKQEHWAQVRPDLPNLLAVGEHNPIITFHLRPGIRWHDGVPLTAEDVKFTYQAIIDPRNATRYASSFEPVRAVEVIDPLTVRVIYKRLYSPGLIDWEIEIIPKHLLDDAALAREADRRKLSADERKKLSVRTTIFNQNPVGSGPFRFVEWLPDQFIHIGKNEQYWGEKAQYQDVFFRVIPDYLTMELELSAGALDMYEALLHQVERYRHDPTYDLLPWDEGYYAYIGYNERRPMFRDKRVRRALGMAIDVEAIMRYVLSGEGRRATGPYYTITPYHDPSTKPLPFDPQAAAALLAEAGWRKNAKGILEKDGQPFAFTLVTNNGNPERKAILQIAQEAWKKLGIDCKVQAFEWTVFLEEFVHQLNFDAIVLAWAGGAIGFDKHEFYHSSQVKPYQSNHLGYSNPEVDKLLVEIRETYDRDALLEKTHRLHRIIADEQPQTFLYEKQRPVVLDKRVAQVEHGADGKEQLKAVKVPPSGDLFLNFSKWRKFSGVARPSAE